MLPGGDFEDAPTPLPSFLGGRWSAPRSPRWPAGGAHEEAHDGSVRTAEPASAAAARRSSSSGMQWRRSRATAPSPPPLLLVLRRRASAARRARRCWRCRDGTQPRPSSLRRDAAALLLPRRDTPLSASSCCRRGQTTVAWAPLMKELLRSFKYKGIRRALQK
jgi:hypothetical protein